MNKILQRIKDGFVSGGRFSPVVTAVLLAILIAVNGIVYALTTYFGLYLYSSDAERLDVSDTTAPLFEKLELAGRKVEILFCMAEEDLAQHDTGAFVYHTAKQLSEKYPEVISLEYMNILTKVDSKGYRRTEEIEHYKKGLAEGEILRDTSVVFTYQTISGAKSYRVLTDNTSIGFATFFMLDASGNAVAYQGEQMLTAMSILSTDKPAKKAYFTQYHGEIVDVSLTSLLICAGYDIKVVNLRDQEIPNDCDLLVISAPQTDFEKASPDSGVRTEIERLTDYVNGGKDLFVTTHSYLKADLKNFDAFLADHGISLVKSEGAVGIVKDTVNSVPTDPYTLVASYAEGDLLNKLSPKLEGLGGVVLTETAALSLTKNAKPLLRSSSASVLEAGGKTVDSAGLYALAAVAPVDGGGSIVVVPSVYLTATDAMTSNSYSNRTFVYGVIETYFEGENLPYGTKTISLMTDMLENLTARAARIYSLIIFFVPTAIAAFGFVLLRRRRNR